jgi:hypothetical protein
MEGVVSRYKARGMNGEKAKRIHRLRAENALGRVLPVKAVVHHADGSLNPDAPLVICEDTAYHSLLHVRMKVVAAGGNPNTQRACSMCKKLVALENMAGKKVKKAYCNVCNAAYTKRRRDGQERS